MAQNTIFVENYIPEPQEEFDPLTPNTSMVYHTTKRIFDILGSTIIMVVLSPIFIGTAIAIKINDPTGSIIYKQKRTGWQGKPFDFLKFRSMVANADAVKNQLRAFNEMDGPVFKIKNDPRITKIGKFIRKTSIDELPQLWNVLKGDMSLVGPRPLPVSEEMGCTPYQRQREMVKPGITCYWQVNGRNRLDFSQWVDLDIKYIREQGILTDFRLLLKTIPAVFSGRGAA